MILWGEVAHLCDTLGRHIDVPLYLHKPIHMATRMPLCSLRIDTRQHVRLRSLRAVMQQSSKAAKQESNKAGKQFSERDVGIVDQRVPETFIVGLICSLRPSSWSRDHRVSTAVLLQSHDCNPCVGNRHIHPCSSLCCMWYCRL